MTPGFAELLKGAPLILLDRPDRAVSTGPTQFLHDLRRRAGQRAERAQQARVFVSPLFVFGWKHPSNPKRIGNGPTIRRERIDHPKPLQNIARTEFPSGHLAPAPRDNGERSASRLCAPTPLRKLARGLSFLNEADYGEVDLKKAILRSHISLLMSARTLRETWPSVAGRTG